ncbi:molybdopterin-dependent oxidoreductase [Microlunatus aurantiacus]|uniref:molybdopterin-dependent oxidoreductase n=1 Tax=Microlunatus aurantiacus TaxID=446786 RepID=UPI0031E15FCD
MPATAAARPAWWPHFSSPVRSTALTARLGRALGTAFALCFLTGLLSYTQYLTWAWLPKPVVPVWGYRLTQGIHVTTGIASIPLVLIKLWSVYPNSFRWPPVPSVTRLLERLSAALLISATLVQLVTGFLNLLDWRPFGWDFVVVHYALAYVVVGAVLLHVAIKLPDIRYGSSTRLADGDVLTEVPWHENPASHSNAGPLPPPVPNGISRRGVLIAAAAGIGVVVITSVGQTVAPLERLGLLAVRQPGRGPQGVPVGRTAEEAGVTAAATDPAWRLEVTGPRAYALGLDDLEPLATRQVRLPVAAGQGWGVTAEWRGIPLLDLVQRAGGTSASRVVVRSLGKGGITKAELTGSQLEQAILATHLNGSRLDVDHGYPLRLVGPNRAELFDTKWIGALEVRG